MNKDIIIPYEMWEVFQDYLNNAIGVIESIEHWDVDYELVVIKNQLESILNHSNEDNQDFMENIDLLENI